MDYPEIEPKSDIQLKCDLTFELRLMAFKCKVCARQCPFGKYLIDELAEWELDQYHKEPKTNYQRG